jgi:hypothetical protein
LGIKYDKLKKLSNEEFKRATGVKRKTFEIMLFEVNKAENKRKLKAKGRGRKPNLTIEDEIIMTLEYLREYRTMFHIGVDYGVNESRVCRIVKKIENILIKCKQFHLPGKKEFQKTDVAFEVVLVDATESPIERPKKNKNNSIVERKRSIH